MRTFALIGCALLLAGCAAQPKAPAKATPIAPSEERTDEIIGREVRHRLQTVCPAEAPAIRVIVNDGTVTLQGVVPSQTAAWRAQAVATAVPGVKAVRNELWVQK
ncbi:MAG: BON domain-containing protein [Verrucomicrobiae bacterium]|nr:BON domain-containing protein [Verrucomicrobiae bacterium]